MIKRLIALVLCLLLCLSCLPAHAEETPVFTVMGLETDTNGRTWEGNTALEALCEKAGVRFEYLQYNDAALYQAALEEAIATDNLPDVLFKAHLTPEQEMSYVSSGILVDLAPLLAENAPTLSTILSARPDWAAIISQPNGVIASLPALNGAERQCSVWINQSWLKALNLQMPTTIEEFTQVLTAFATQDPNLNGKADETPLSLCGPWEAKYLLHAFGLTPNDYNIYADENGTVHFAPFEEGYYEFVEFLKMALENGLINEDAFRISDSVRTASLRSQEEDAPQTIGAMISYAPYTLLETDYTNQFAVMPPLSEEGTGAYRRLLTGVTRGTFAITTACEDPAAVLRWVDLLYTEEGGRIAYAGIENVNYTIAENGEWQWNGGDDYNTLVDLSRYAIFSGDGLTPGLEPAAFMRNSEIDYDTYSRRQTDTIRLTFKEAYPVLWPTDAEREERIASLHAAVATCLDTAIAEFAMDVRELNEENWNALLSELRALGAEEMTQLFQDKLDESK